MAEAVHQNASREANSHDNGPSSLAQLGHVSAVVCDHWSTLSTEVKIMHHAHCTEECTMCRDLENEIQKMVHD